MFVLGNEIKRGEGECTPGLTQGGGHQPFLIGSFLIGASTLSHQPFLLSLKRVPSYATPASTEIVLLRTYGTLVSPGVPTNGEPDKTRILLNTLKHT